MKRLATPIRALLAVGIFAAFLLLIGGGVASADGVTLPGGGTADACGTPIDTRGAKANGDVTFDSTDQAANSNLLTINRWGSVADNFHTRLDAAPFSDLVPALQRNVLTNTMIQTGNSMWQGSTAMTAFATRFCLMDKLGYTADHLSAQFGNAVLRGGLVTLITVGGVVVLIWRAKSSGSSPWKGIGRMLAILSLMGVMVSAATHTGQSTDKQHTTFAMGSPGYFGSTINNVIASLSNLPSSMVSSTGSQLEAKGYGAGDDNLSCANATKALREAYTQQYGPGMSQLAASIPLTMSQMWENTGLASWEQAQFGSANPYGPLVYCHVLEDTLNTPRHNGNAGVADPVTPQLQTQLGLLLSKSSSTPGGLNGDSVAWDYQVNSKTLDQSMIGWAACRWDGGKWTVNNIWQSVASGGKAGGGNDVSGAAGHLNPDGSDCQKWWTTNPDKIDLADVNMNYEDNPGYIRSATSVATQAPVGNFLLNWHGNDNGTAFTLAAVYLIAAFVMMVIFGGISLGIIIAKVAMIVLIALIFLALVASLWPGNGGSRLSNYVKFYLGTALFTFGISVVFSLITMVTGFLADAGVGQFGAGSLMSTLWTGLSPIAAIWVLNMIFKHGLKMPSPLKPGAALAYGAAIGGIGMAAGAGVESLFNRAKNKGRNGARSGGRSMKNLMRPSTSNPTVPGNSGVQKIQPKDDPTTPAPVSSGAPGDGAAGTGGVPGTGGAGADTAAAAATSGAGPSAASTDALAARPAEAPADGAAGAAVGGAGDTAVMPPVPSDAADTAAAAGGAAPAAGDTVLSVPLPIPAKPLSATAQRAADIKALRLATKHHRTGGVGLKTGRTAGLQRRTNNRLMKWAERSTSSAGYLARASTAGLAMMGVAGMRGAAGVIDNAQQRVVRRTKAGWNNAALFNRGKDRAKLAMASMRAKPLRTAAKFGAFAVAAANPVLLLGVGAIAARKGYNRARPKGADGQRQSALATRRRNAPLRRSAKDQARLDAWSAHQSSLRSNLPALTAAAGATGGINTGGAFTDGDSGQRTVVDPLNVGGTDSSQGTMPLDRHQDKDYVDADGLAPVFNSMGIREILDRETRQVHPHALQDFNIEQQFLTERAAAAGEPAPSPYEIIQSMQETQNGRGEAINSGAVVPAARQASPDAAGTRPAPVVNGGRPSTLPGSGAVPPYTPSVPPAPSVTGSRPAAPGAVPPYTPSVPSAPRRPAGQGRPAPIVNQQPVRRRPPWSGPSVRPSMGPAARASRPNAPVGPARAVRPPSPAAPAAPTALRTQPTAPARSAAPVAAPAAPRTQSTAPARQVAAPAAPRTQPTAPVGTPPQAVRPAAPLTQPPAPASGSVHAPITGASRPPVALTQPAAPADPSSTTPRTEGTSRD